MIRSAVVVGWLFASQTAWADLANNEAIHAHIDAVIAGINGATLDPDVRRSLLADRATLSLGALIPIYGSYVLDRKIFGGVRPSAVVFDWILGGLVPAGLGITALATDGSLSPRTRSILGWTAIGLYASTRLGVLIVGNLHVSEYNRYLKLGLGVAESPQGQLAPAIVATASW